MKTSKFVRKPFYVDGIRLTSENLAEAAEWCGGTICDDSAGKPMLKVEVTSARHGVQPAATGRPGDWVLKGEKGFFKVFNNKAFTACFDTVEPASETDLQNLKEKLSPDRV